MKGCTGVGAPCGSPAKDRKWDWERVAGTEREIWGPLACGQLWSPKPAPQLTLHSIYNLSQSFSPPPPHQSPSVGPPSFGFHLCHSLTSE